MDNPLSDIFDNALCWKDGYSPTVVASHGTEPECYSVWSCMPQYIYSR